MNMHSVLHLQVLHAWLGDIYYFSYYHDAQAITLCIPALAYLPSTLWATQKTEFIHSKHVPFSVHFIMLQFTGLYLIVSKDAKNNKEFI